MTILYSYDYTFLGEGPWWGIRCSQSQYTRIVQQMQETRCFVYLTNEQNNTIAVAVEGPHNEGEDILFGPQWLLQRLGLDEGETVSLTIVGHLLPKAISIKLKPIDGISVEGPMFIEGLTEALNQLGVLQKGLLSAVVDPSLPEIHQFYIEELDPDSICLADGELRVELLRAVNRPDTPVPSEPKMIVPDSTSFDWSTPMVPETVSMPAPTAFGGRGNLLGRSRLV
jgi:hypothetical protein